MKIFLNEIKTRWFSTFLWLIGLIVFMVIALIEFEAMKKTGPALQDFMDNIPTILKSVFGMNEMELSSPSGYMGIIGFYTLILLAIHGLFLGISVISRESQQKTSDFLFTKPVSRKTIFNTKVLGGVAVILFLNGFLMVFSGFYAASIVGKQLSMHYIMAYFALNSVMYAYGLFLASFFNKRASQIGLITILVMYLIPILVDVSGIHQIFKKLSIISMFDVQTMQTILPLYEVLTLLVIASVFIMLARGGYKRRDIIS